MYIGGVSGGVTKSLSCVHAVCREQVPLSEGGVDALPPARLAANLLDKYKRTDPKDAQHDIESECLVHGNKPLDFYCIDCQVFLCHQCSQSRVARPFITEEGSGDSDQDTVAKWNVIIAIPLRMTYTCM